MTRATGWLGNDEPDEQAPEPQRTPGVADFILANRAAPGQGRTLEQVLARALQAPDRGGPEPEPEPADFDDKAAGWVTRGYRPGAINELSMRLGDVEARLADERAKLEKSARQAAYLHRAHEAGRITGFDILRTLADADEGDEGLVARLEHQAGSLRQQIAEAHEAISPPRQRERDGVEAAAQRAHQIFTEVTRQKMAAAQARRPEPRPFAGRGSVGLAVRSEVTCAECVAAGASPAESFLIHSDPQPVPVPAEAEAGEGWPLRFDASGREVIRADGWVDGRLGNYQPVAYR